MSNLLLIISGLAGLIAYGEIIRIGYRDKTYGMPIAALLGNISWEFFYSFIYPHGDVQQYVDYLWFSFDLVIYFQVLKYWRTEIKNISSAIFYPAIFFFQIAAYLLIVYIEKDFNSYGMYSGYADNFMMSILFILMLFKRKSLRGQSVSIAFFKMICTLAAAIWGYKYYQRSDLLTFFYASIFILDFIYLILVFLQAKKSLLFPVEKIA